jgi:hypothetical protein
MDLSTLIPSLDFGTLLYYLFALTLLDFVVGTALAISRSEFSWDLVAGFLRTHVAFRVLPITATALFAHGLPGLTPPLDLLWAGVYASCVLYLGETVRSILDNLAAPTPPAQPAQ